MKLTPVPSKDHEEIYCVEDDATGLHGYIAVHSTCLGPAAGGLRMRRYDSAQAALTDVKRLSEGMTYKNAAAGLPLGGGKAVIIGDPGRDKTPDLLHAFGRAIDSLQGRYYTAEDMGMAPSDMAHLARATPYVAGLSEGRFASGDPSPITARGIFNAIRTAQKHHCGSAELAGVTVAIQGLGNVGWHLCDLLSMAGASLIITDTDATRVSRAEAVFGGRSVDPDKIYSVEADIFAPCAIGGILNATTIPRLNVAIVAGGANNQLATSQDGADLHARGILYAPDFVANGGGIINVATEILKISNRAAFVEEKLIALDLTMQAILGQARAENISPDSVAIATVQVKMARSAA